MDIQLIFTYLFGAVVFLLPLFALYKCILNKSLSVRDKILWALGILIIPVFGAVVYLLTNTGRKK